MRLLTKVKACRELSVSLSTLDRRIASGEVRTKREPHGRRHRVYVMLDNGPLTSIETLQSELAMAQERIRGLEEQVAFLQEQLELERRRNAELVKDLKAAPERSGPWWQFWQSRRCLRWASGPGCPISPRIGERNFRCRWPE